MSTTHGNPPTSTGFWRPRWSRAAGRGSRGPGTLVRTARRGTCYAPYNSSPLALVVLEVRLLNDGGSKDYRPKDSLCHKATCRVVKRLSNTSPAHRRLLTSHAPRTGTSTWSALIEAPATASSGTATALRGKLYREDSPIVCVCVCVCVCLVLWSSAHYPLLGLQPVCYEIERVIL